MSRLNGLFNWLESLLHRLTLLYVLRVPILCALALLLICFGANSALVGNLFDVNNVLETAKKTRP